MCEYHIGYLHMQKKFVNQACCADFEIVLNERYPLISAYKHTVFQKSRKMTKNHRECISKNIDEIFFK